jgi:repressor LexA
LEDSRPFLDHGRRGLGGEIFRLAFHGLPDEKILKIELLFLRHIVKLHDMLSPVHLRIAKTLLAWERRGEPGFVPDLVRALGYAAESSLTATLRVMERDGLITIKGGGARGRSRMIALTARGRMAVGAAGLPVLGSIPAGPLSEAVQTADDVRDPGGLLPWQDGDFLLRVRGDSMEGDGILDGDLVLLRPDAPPRPGEIAAVLVGDDHEATLKHLHVQKDTAILRASNPRYPDVAVPADTVKIAGVFRGLVRQARAGS